MNITTHSNNPPSIDPAAWWRMLCWVTPQIAVSGDLDTRRADRGVQQLREWVDAGVTHIVDAREEWNDERFVGVHAPDLTYHWVGTHDDGSGQSDEWFEAGVRVAVDALRDPSAKVVLHCHMGVNRGPSLTFALLLALGFDPVQALTAIRAARPIAATLYAEDAVDWWHRRIGSSESVRHAARECVRTWLETHATDAHWVISRIRRAS